MFTRDFPHAVVMMVLAVLLLANGGLADDDQYKAPPQYGPVTDQDEGLLAIPEKYRKDRDFTVAGAPPTITFSTMNGLPELTREQHGLWSLWGEGIYASNGKYYTGVGDHRGVDAHVYLYEYDPKTHRQRRVVDLARLIDQQPGDYGHGKMHGRLDETPDGWIYAATYWGGHPDALGPDKLCRIGGRLFRYNCRTDEVEDLGQPLPGDSFPMHATDTRRGIFHGVGLYGGYLAYDLYRRRPLYAGKLPGDVTWDLRCTLVDPKTGHCYGCEMHTRRIVYFDPADGAFHHTTAEVPHHPIEGKEYKPYIRSHTNRRLGDGSFICQTYDGVMFKFFPDQSRVEYIGLNWGEGLYSTAMALSDDDRFLYYTVGAHGSTWEQGSPLIQMNTFTYDRKVLAFLHPYYQDKHGYIFGGAYSIQLGPRDASLILSWNGRFRRAEAEGESFGHPTFMHVQIPASER